MIMAELDQTPSICVVCAWRADCKKKYSLAGGMNLRCPEFSRDVTLRDKAEGEATEAREDDGGERWRNGSAR